METWDYIPDSYADNAHILAWWSSRHDELIRDKSSELAWFWPWSIIDNIVETTSAETIDQWRASDPLCKQYAWYNILMNFSIARANRHGLRAREQRPQSLLCARCNSEFNQSSLPHWTKKRLGGLEALRFCASCCKSGFFGRDSTSPCNKPAIRNYLQRLHDVSGVIPNANFFDVPGPLVGLDVQTQSKLLDIGAERPSNQCIKRKYSSYLAALIDAGILPDGTRKTSRGVQCLAEDGHLCLSFGEKMIDDWLYNNGFQHEL